ncbi:MAG: alpha-2-macroglobulin [Betaproteobacteria bacterium]|nr:alpha-2-macroglobulin [Betaproteobacteria bacterium]
MRRVLAAATDSCAVLIALALAACGGSALAARVASVSPQGEVAEMRQVLVRFDAAVVPAGDPRAPAPFVLSCAGRTPPGQARWLNERDWALDLAQPLPAGEACTLTMRSGFQPLAGALEGPREFRFTTGAPVVVSVQPYPGSRIAEDQHFLLHLNGTVDPASLQTAVWCEMEGLLDRLPVTVVDGAARQAVLRANRWPDDRPALLVACTRPLAADTRVRLVWGPGVKAPGAGAPVSRRTQRFEWKVQARFSAEFSCEREQAPPRGVGARDQAPAAATATAPAGATPLQTACMPLRPLTLNFSAPVPRAQALAVRLVPDGGGAAIAPSLREDERGETLQSVRFAAPLPENTRFRLTLPPGVQDDAGRALANAGSFPLVVATGSLPPLAKFAGAPFGILESSPDPAAPALMPLTLRHVQADLAGVATGGQVRVRRLGAETPDLELLRWLARLRKDHDEQFKTRSQSLLASEPGVRRADLPQLKDPAPRATEVIGIPLPQRGYHVIEVESRLLGQRLLAERGPMYARTGALVTNLAVHFKRGRSSSLVWVTTLDRGRPVAGARVAVNDCHGKPAWNGSTDAAGMARIDRGFDNGDWDARQKCLSREGWFVTARVEGKDGDDLAFVFSDWTRGIEPWRFNLPQSLEGTPDQRAHTVFDRTLLRAGETVSMKHFLRVETERGLALPDAAALPTQLVLTHQGSGTETRLPLAWPRGARAAESTWAIPKNAALGAYDVALQQGERVLPSGSLRVEAFRVPLVDARLSGPAGVQVAPRDVAFAAQLNAMAGGPLAGRPVQLSALLRGAAVQFKGHDDFSFDAPRQRSEGDDEGPETRQKLVADKLAATTDAQGAARLKVDKLPPLTAPADLLAELRFDDLNGEVQTVAQRLRLWPAAVVVGLRVPGWTAARGDAGLTAVVLSNDGKPMKDRAVEVSGRLHQTFSARKRIVGGFYAYDNRHEVRELGVLCSGKTDALGRLRCDVKLDAAGEVELIARTRDDAGRESVAASSVWVSGRGEWWFSQDNDDRIDVLPESREVEPGQTARLQVRMPYRQAMALVTVEREGLIDARVVQLTGREPVIELPIPATADRSWAPNVVVGVLVLRGRLRDAPWWSLFTWGWREPGEWWRAFRYEGRDYRAPTAVVDLAKPSFKFGAAQLDIGRAQHRLDVTVTPERTQYKVRETAMTTVQVSFQGKPLAGAEIAFAAVDEGLLALQTNTSWELLPGLLHTRPWGVETSTAQGEIVGRRHYGRKALPPGGGGGSNPTRELFDTLLLWRGTVQLDAQGQARIAVPLNDSLTSFRLVAIADAGAGTAVERFGTGSASVRVTQDLQMLSGLPPLAREGDRFDAGFTLRNTTARALTVQATLAGQAVGAATPALTLPPQTVTLPAGVAQELRWPVQVPNGATHIEWDAAATETSGATPLRDRLKIKQAIASAVPVRVWQASLQPLDASFTLALAPPAGALPGAGGVQATLQPKLTGALPGLRRYFETYPYTCLEQKTSRALGLRDAAAWATLRGEAAGYLDSDGLAGYFPPTPGSPPRGSDRLTAYLLSAAHEAGWAWPEATRDAMLGGLQAFVEGRIERRFNAPRADLDVRKLAALDALARHGRVQARWLGSVAWTPAAWPTSALLDAWGLYRRADALPDRAARLDELLRLVRSRLIAGGTTLKFSTEQSDDWWWLMDGPDANAARLLLAAVDSAEWQAELPQILNGTLARQRRGAWSTTTANLWGVLALERFGAKFEATPVAGRSTLQWGATTRMQDWQAAPTGGTQSLPWPSGSAPFTARHEGAGRPWLALQTLAAVPLQAPLAAGYRVSRSVTAVERKRPDAWSRGDVLRVRLDVEALGDMAWVVFSDPVPTGATLLGSGLGRDSLIATQGERREGRALPAYEERGFDTWRAYYEWLPRGKHVIEYTLRLNASGRFGLPPTRVEAMYAPESFGESPNAALEVGP